MKIKQKIIGATAVIAAGLTLMSCSTVQDVRSYNEVVRMQKRITSALIEDMKHKTELVIEEYKLNPSEDGFAHITTDIPVGVKRNNGASVVVNPEDVIYVPAKK